MFSKRLFHTLDLPLAAVALAGCVATASAAPAVDAAAMTQPMATAPTASTATPVFGVSAITPVTAVTAAAAPSANPPAAHPTTVIAALAPANPSSQQAAPLRKVSLPPSADLHYRIRAQQSGLTIDGTGEVQWQSGDGKFSVTSESRASLFGKVLEAKSVGDVDQFGLAPTSFNNKRFRKDATTTTFDRQSKTIRFSASAATYPIKGGEQDRNSVMWQLISVARAAEGKFKNGSEWRFFVAGQRDAEPWIFKVDKTEKIRTALGDLSTVHVVRAPPPDAKGQQLDIWLAPSMEWYPARVRFTDPDGEYIEQTLESIART